jgi:hypothetical protein
MPKAQSPGQIGWDFDHTEVGRTAQARPRQSRGQQVAAGNRRTERKNLRQGDSPFAAMNFAGVPCGRCSHGCDERHRPGRTGACTTPRCPCQYATVLCACGHDTADHEAFEQGTATPCHLCACRSFALPAGVVPQ